MKHLRTVVFGVLLFSSVAISAPSPVVLAHGRADSVADPFGSTQNSVVLVTMCVERGNRVAMAAARAACDELAEAKSYTHGVVRPPNPNDFDGAEPAGCASKDPDITLVLNVCVGIN